MDRWPLGGIPREYGDRNLVGERPEREKGSLLLWFPKLPVELQQQAMGERRTQTTVKNRPKGKKIESARRNDGDVPRCWGQGRGGKNAGISTLFQLGEKPKGKKLEKKMAFRLKKKRTGGLKKPQNGTTWGVKKHST